MSWKKRIAEHVNSLLFQDFGSRLTDPCNIVTDALDSLAAYYCKDRNN
jgi:hypothetical protein